MKIKGNTQHEVEKSISNFDLSPTLYDKIVLPFLIMAGTAVVFFLMGSFMEWEWNPANWSEPCRISVAIFWLAFTIVAINRKNIID